MQYKVLADVEILGEIRATGTTIELDEQTAAPFVAGGQLEAVTDTPPSGGATAPTTPTPPAPPASTAATPAPATPAPAKDKKEGGWVGGHTVSGNEQNTIKGGGLRESAIAGKK